MSVRYTIKCEQDDPLLRPFEETMSFGPGFRQMAVPASVGTGQLTALEIDPEFHVNFQFYRLSVPLEVTKEWQGDAGHFVTIAFYDLELPQKAWTWMRGNEVVYDQQGVNIYTGATNLTMLFPANTERNVVCIRITRQKLESILGDEHREYLQELLRGEGQFFLHEPLSPVMRSLLGQLKQQELKQPELKRPQVARGLQQLYYHTRTLELLYLLLEQLNNRTGGPCKSTDPEHIARIFQAKSLLIRDLSEPPTIAALASAVLMSESQLKQSFREVFGVSIYQYFQQERLERAKQLLSENNRTVKEVGYELGFTNIGHFSRLFERLYHIKPKKFQIDRRGVLEE
jgi:AraC-like DNA-binding protein